MTTGTPCSLGEPARRGRVRDGPVGARHERGADAPGELAGRHLVAQHPDGLRRRPDPGQAGVEDGLGEVGVLGEEAVAGVDGVGAAAAGDVEQPGDVEVGLRRRWRRAGCTPRRRAARAARRRRGRRRRRPRRRPGVGAGVDDAEGDLAAVGDEDLAHGCSFPTGAQSAGRDEPQDVARAHLGEPVEVGGAHHGDDRVAAGGGVVGEEHHRQAGGRHLHGARDGALAGQLLGAGARERPRRPGGGRRGWTGRSPPSPARRARPGRRARTSPAAGPGTTATVTGPSGHSGAGSGAGRRRRPARGGRTGSTAPASSGSGPSPDIVSRRPAAEHRRDVEPAAHGDVGAQPRPRRAEREDLARRAARTGRRCAAGARRRRRASTVSGTAAPVTASTWSPSARSRSPPSTVSTTAASRGLPTRRLARTAAPRSTAPEGQTPRSR